MAEPQQHRPKPSFAVTPWCSPAAACLHTPVQENKKKRARASGSGQQVQLQLDRLFQKPPKKQQAAAAAAAVTPEELKKLELMNSIAGREAMKMQLQLCRDLVAASKDNPALVGDAQAALKLAADNMERME